jgi:Flp pilus assembly protein TadG
MRPERRRSTRHRDSGTVAVGAAIGARDHGAEAVEFALVVPIFLLLVFGIVDFGYMINRDTMVNNASREGARAGALNPNQAGIISKVSQALASGGMVMSIQPTVTCRKPDNTPCGLTTFDADAKPGGVVIVKVEYQHSWITPVGSTIKPGGIRLSKTTEMRIE